MEKLTNLKGAKVLSKAEQKSINGGTAGTCGTANGNTGKSCSTNTPCVGPNNPACHNGCCNIWV